MRKPNQDLLAAGVKGFATQSILYRKARI